MLDPFLDHESMVEARIAGLKLNHAHLSGAGPRQAQMLGTFTTAVIQ